MPYYFCHCGHQSNTGERFQEQRRSAGEEQSGGRKSVAKTPFDFEFLGELNADSMIHGVSCRFRLENLEEGTHCSRSTRVRLQACP